MTDQRIIHDRCLSHPARVPMLAWLAIVACIPLASAEARQHRTPAASLGDPVESSGLRFDKEATTSSASSGVFTFWTNQAGGDFQDADNWSAGVPDGQSIARFDLATDGYMVNFLGDAVSRMLEIGEDRLSFDLQGAMYFIGSDVDDWMRIGEFGEKTGDLTVRDGRLVLVGDVLLERGRLRFDTGASLVAEDSLLMSPGVTLVFELHEDDEPASGTPFMMFGNLAGLNGHIRLTLNPTADPPPGTVFSLIEAPSSAGHVEVVTTPAFSAYANDLRFLQVGGAGSLARAAGGGSVTSMVEELIVDLEFDAPSTTTVTGDPQSADVADFDGIDGNDVVIAVDGTPGGVKVLYNNGAGTEFTEGSLVSTGNSPRGVAVGDFDGFGGPDVVVANAADANVAILFNDGAGMLGSLTTVTAGNEPVAVVTGDFDGDADTDFAVANRTDGTVMVFVNDAGGFERVATLTAGNGPRALAAGLFDANGTLDLAVSNETDGTVTLFFNEGGAAFTTSTTVTVGTSPGIIDPEDLDNDKDTDLVVTNEGSNDLTIIRNGGGLLGRAQVPTYTVSSFGAGTAPSSVDAADLDGDGDVDLAVVLGNSSTRTIRILRNDSTTLGPTSPLVFATDSDLATDASLILARIAPFDGEGGADLVGVSAAAPPSARAPVRAAGVSANVRFLLNVSGPVCVSDSTNDGIVDIQDLLDLLAAWGPCAPPCPEDTDANGVVDILDLLQVLADWGACP